MIVISGPSGVGKTTVCQALLETGRFRRGVTATTRAPREGEVDGRDYHFLTVEEFQKRIKAGGFLEYARVHGAAWYGTPKAETEALVEEGHDVLLSIDVQGAAALRGQRPPGLLTIFLLPPDESELEERLLGRNDTSDVARRLETARAELARAHEFDVQVVNRTIEGAAREVEAAVERARG